MSLVAEDIERIAWKWKMQCRTCVHFRASDDAAKLAKRVQRELAYLTFQTSVLASDPFGMCLATTTVVSPQADVCNKFRQSMKPLRDALASYVPPPQNVTFPLRGESPAPQQLYTLKLKISPQNEIYATNAPAGSCTVEIKPMLGATLQDARPYAVEVSCACGWQRVEGRLANRSEAEAVGIETAKRHMREAHTLSPPPEPEVECSEIDGVRFRNVERSRK